MRDMCRLIIETAIKEDFQKKEDMEKLKRKVCSEEKSHGFISNSKILKYVKPDEMDKLRPLLMKKPTRTISGVAMVAVMCHPHECPHGRCMYCPESNVAPPSYTGEEPAALRARMFNYHPYIQVYNRLFQLKIIGHPVDKIELIIMGGTFASRPLCYQEWFVTQCLRAMNDFSDDNPIISDTRKKADIKAPVDFEYLHDSQLKNQYSNVKCVGMTFETRPDFSKIEDVNRMLSMGVTRVELGVQTLYNYKYKRIDRGHRIQDVIEANQILHDSGLKVAMHMMPGLFSDFESDKRMFKRLFNEPIFSPDMLKIYPCLVTKGSKLYDLWQEGKYEPYTSEDAVDLIVEIKKFLPKWVRTMRIQRDIPATLIDAGVKKSNLGELVYNKLQEKHINCQCIRCREVGHKKRLGITPDIDHIKLLKTEYESVGGQEIFLSIEDTKNDILIGFTRLRIPSDNIHREEITLKTGLIRELHVYGQMLPIGKKEDSLWQHKGYGEQLIKEAEKIAKEEYDKKKMLIISGIGVKNYYKRLGYDVDGVYMGKCLK